LTEAEGKLNLILTKKGTPFPISSLTGGSGILSNGSSVTFPADAFVGLDGSNFTGTANVYLVNFQPSSPDFSESSPGASDLEGVQKNGTKTLLYSFGTLSVEIEDQNGNPLQLKPNRLAEVKMKITANQVSVAPPEMPLWFFDQNTGSWKEEGNVIKAGGGSDYYVGDVSHFSSWSASNPTGRGTLKGKIVDSLNKPVPGIKVRVGQLSVVTRQNGEFEGVIFLNIPIEIFASTAESEVFKSIPALTQPNQSINVGNLKLVRKTPTVTDQDGNVYQTKTIGSQTWMISNLKTTKFKEGSPIPTGLSGPNWQSTTQPAYAVYRDSLPNDNTYGKLYNYYTVVNSKGLCPTGWHVPTDSEWTTLQNYLGGTQVAGGKLKMVSDLWNASVGTTNESGFNGLPGGLRNRNGLYSSIRDFGYFWTPTEILTDSALVRYLDGNNISLGRSPYKKQFGFSVRCLRDN
jgi:uncharacterized protein (TIGR02145 family)